MSTPNNVSSADITTSAINMNTTNAPSTANTSTANPSAYTSYSLKGMGEAMKANQRTMGDADGNTTTTTTRNASAGGRLTSPSRPSRMGSGHGYGLNTSAAALGGESALNRSHGIGVGGGAADGGDYTLYGRTASSHTSRRASPTPAASVRTSADTNTYRNLSPTRRPMPSTTTTSRPTSGGGALVTSTAHPVPANRYNPHHQANMSIVVAPDPARSGLEVALLHERSSKDDLALSIVQLNAQLSREKDETEIMRCRAVRIEGEMKGLEEELAEAHSETRKAKQEAEHYRRVHQEVSNTKAQLAASRDELRHQLEACRSEVEALTQKCIAVADHRDAVSQMYESLRERSSVTDALLAETQMKLEQTEMQLLTTGEEGRLRHSTHETFQQQISAESDRLAAFIRSITANYQEAMDAELSITTKNPATNSHMLAPHNHLRKDDTITPATELLIFENSKRAPLTVPLYATLHAALREFAVKHKTFRQEFYKRGDAIAKTTILTEDLKHALEDNHTLRNRIAKLEAELDAAISSGKATEREMVETRKQLAGVLTATFDKLGGPTGVIPSHDSVALLSLCETAKDLVVRVTDEVKAYRSGKKELQAQVTRLLGDIEERRIAHELATDELHRANQAAIDEAVHNTRVLTEASAAAECDKRLALKDRLIDDITAQREALVKGNEDLKQALHEARREASEAAVRATNAEHQCKDALETLAVERAAHQTAKMEVFVLQERILKAEEETSRERALALLGGGGKAGDADNTSSLVMGGMPKLHDRLSPFETMLITLQALNGATSNLSALASSSRAASRLIAYTHPKGVYYSKRPHCAHVLRFRVAVIAVMAANRVGKLINTLHTEGIAAHNGHVRGDISKVWLPLGTRVLCDKGVVLTSRGLHDTSEPYTRGLYADGASSSNGNDIVNTIKEALHITADGTTRRVLTLGQKDFIFPTVGEAQHPAHMLTLLVDQLKGGAGGGRSKRGGNSSSTDSYSPSLAERLQDGLNTVLRTSWYGGGNTSTAAGPFITSNRRPSSSSHRNQPTTTAAMLMPSAANPSAAANIMTTTNGRSGDPFENSLLSPPTREGMLNRPNNSSGSGDDGLILGGDDTTADGLNASRRRVSIVDPSALAGAAEMGVYGHDGINDDAGESVHTRRDISPPSPTGRRSSAAGGLLFANTNAAVTATTISTRGPNLDPSAPASPFATTATHSNRSPNSPPGSFPSGQPHEAAAEAVGHGHPLQQSPHTSPTRRQSVYGNATTSSNATSNGALPMPTVLNAAAAVPTMLPQRNIIHTPAGSSGKRRGSALYPDGNVISNTSTNSTNAAINDNLRRQSLYTTNANALGHKSSLSGPSGVPMYGGAALTNATYSDAQQQQQPRMSVFGQPTTTTTTTSGSVLGNVYDTATAARRSQTLAPAVVGGATTVIGAPTARGPYPNTFPSLINTQQPQHQHHQQQRYMGAAAVPQVVYQQPPPVAVQPQQQQGSGGTNTLVITYGPPHQYPSATSRGTSSYAAPIVGMGGAPYYYGGVAPASMVGVGAGGYPLPQQPPVAAVAPSTTAPTSTTVATAKAPEGEGVVAAGPTSAATIKRKQQEHHHHHHHHEHHYHQKGDGSFIEEDCVYDDDGSSSVSDDYDDNYDNGNNGSRHHSSSRRGPTNRGYAATDNSRVRSEGLNDTHITSRSYSSTGGGGGPRNATSRRNGGGGGTRSGRSSTAANSVNVSNVTAVPPTVSDTTRRGSGYRTNSGNARGIHQRHISPPRHHQNPNPNPHQHDRNQYYDDDGASSSARFAADDSRYTTATSRSSRRDGRDYDDDDGTTSNLIPAALAKEASQQLLSERRSQNAFASEVLNVIRALDNKIEASLIRKRF